MNTTKLMLLVISAIVFGYIINDIFYSNVALELDSTIIELLVGFAIGNIVAIYKKGNNKKDLEKSGYSFDFKDDE